MSVSPSPLLRSAVVTRLRAAGCVFAEDEARLLVSTARTPAGLVSMVDRRVAGLPLEHVLGWAEFCGLRVVVDPGVFVPRRRTEFLVSRAAGLAPTRPGTVVVVDLCCGSGAVGVALAAALGGAGPGRADHAGPDHAGRTGPDRTGPDRTARGGRMTRSGRVDLHAADLDPAAVRCARRNVAAAGGRVYAGDLYAPLPVRLRGRIDVLVANVPYVPTGEIGLLPPEARVHEPRVALDGGADGLDVLRRVAAGASGWLAPGGSLLVETSGRQVPGAVAVVAGSGLVPRVAASEDLHATVVTGTNPALPAGPED